MRTLGVCLCAFGLVVASCGDDGAADTSATSPTEPTAMVDQTDSSQPSPGLTTNVDFTEEWQQVAVGEPWVDSIGDVSALPSGGFVAVLSDTSRPSNVVWSPDGVEWLDGDPQQQLPTVPLASPWGDSHRWAGPHRIAATTNGVVVLDQVNLGVRVGEPQTGRWELISLDTTGLDGDVKLRALAANETEVLVLATNEWLAIIDDEEGEEVPVLMAQLVVWLVDTSEATSPTPVVLPKPVEHWLPKPSEDLDSPTPVEWFDGQWIMMAPTGTGDWPTSVWMSPDGKSWTEDTPKGLESPASLIAGSSALLAFGIGMGGDLLWHSLDGLNWNRARVPWGETGCGPKIYSDTLGYVGEFAGEWGDVLWVSSNGTHWRPAGPPPPGDSLLVASDGKLLGYDPDAGNLWLLFPD